MKKISLNELTISSFVTNSDKIKGGESGLGENSVELCVITRDRYCTRDC
ncbi:MAG: pinensin family lanthipeptide [Cyclobacteriaceae bacterium]